ncbi:hypothetical protein WICMUC_000839 [Wickerhamomyces mucosus]|uniref:Rad9-like Rad53-binding domain-containing protein n=1 Tax=Wickerhamomyces mucosus TaxID=1378264 RepID=A0A9P8PW81_9ASCO|nr:hypothetical protein WICMUC_000839 [Wickerhamomyces mucosus]
MDSSTNPFQTSTQTQPGITDFLNDTQVINSNNTAHLTNGIFFSNESQNSKKLQKIKMLTQNDENLIVDSSCDFNPDTQDLLQQIPQHKLDKIDLDFSIQREPNNNNHSSSNNNNISNSNTSNQNNNRNNTGDDSLNDVKDSPDIFKTIKLNGNKSINNIETPWLNKIKNPFEETPQGESRLNFENDNTDQTPSIYKINEFTTPILGKKSKQNIFERMRNDQQNQKDLEIDSQSLPTLTYDFNSNHPEIDEEEKKYDDDDNNTNNNNKNNSNSTYDDDHKNETKDDFNDNNDNDNENDNDDIDKDNDNNDNDDNDNNDNNDNDNNDNNENDNKFDNNYETNDNHNFNDRFHDNYNKQNDVNYKKYEEIIPDIPFSIEKPDNSEIPDLSMNKKIISSSNLTGNSSNMMTRKSGNNQQFEGNSDKTSTFKLENLRSNRTDEVDTSCANLNDERTIDETMKNEATLEDNDISIENQIMEAQIVDDLQSTDRPKQIENQEVYLIDSTIVDDETKADITNGDLDGSLDQSIQVLGTNPDIENSVRSTLEENEDKGEKINDSKEIVSDDEGPGEEKFLAEDSILKIHRDLNANLDSPLNHKYIRNGLRLSSRKMSDTQDNNTILNAISLNENDLHVTQDLSDIDDDTNDDIDATFENERGIQNLNGDGKLSDDRAHNGMREKNRYFGLIDIEDNNEEVDVKVGNTVIENTVIEEDEDMVLSRRLPKRSKKTVNYEESDDEDEDDNFIRYKRRRLNQAHISSSNSVLPDTILRQETKDLTEEDIAFPNAVWSLFNAQYFPGLLLETVKSSTKIEYKVKFSDTVDKMTTVTPLDLRINDLVEIHQVTYIITGLECSEQDINQKEIIRCMRGYDHILVKKHRSKRTIKNGKDPVEKKYPIGILRMSTEEWHKFHRINSDFELRQKRIPHHFDPDILNLTSTPMKSPIKNEVIETNLSTLLDYKLKNTNEELIFNDCLFILTGSREMKDLILQNGGMILENNFGSIIGKYITIKEGVIDAPKEVTKFLSKFKLCALISDKHYRSPKYLEFLSLGWPILSEHFITDSIRFQETLFQRIQHYLLPSGDCTKFQTVKSYSIFKFLINFEKGFKLNDQLNDNFMFFNEKILVINKNSQNDKIAKFLIWALCGKKENIKFVDLKNLSKELSSSKIKDNTFIIYGIDKKTLRKVIGQQWKIFNKYESKIKIVDWEWLVQTVITGFPIETS